MTPRATWAVAARVLRQILRDRRTLAMLVLLPTLLMCLLWWIYSSDPSTVDAPAAGLPPGAVAVEVPDAFTRAAPGLLAIFPMLVMFLVSSVTMLRERTSGTLERLLSLPVGKLDLLGGYGLAFGLFGAVQSTLAVLVSVHVLGLEVDGPVALLVAVAVADAVLGTALGLFVSAFARSEFQAVQFMPAVLVPQMLLCGLLQPREELPGVLHAISNVLPLSWAVDATTAVVADQVDAGVSLNLLGLVLVAVGLLGLGALTLRRRTP